MSDNDASTLRRRAATGAFDLQKNVRWLEEPEAFAADRTQLLPAALLDQNGQACLMVVEGNELARRYRLDKNEMVLGRAASADIQLAAGGVSRVHARIERERGIYRIIDLDSTNGTYVNGLRVAKQTFQNGDRVTLGDTTLRFLISDRLDAACYDEIYRLTTTDDATGIYNRRYFFQTLEREVARAIRHTRPLSLLMLDVDDFRQINQRYGFLAGDALLMQLAGRIQASCRMEDIFARFGGQEFCLMLSETDSAGAQHVVQRLQRIIASHPFLYDGEEITLTASIGSASLEENRPDETSVRNWRITAHDWLDVLLAQANEQLLHAKNEGERQRAL